MDIMNIYGYARLSRDEDKENYESIHNQVNIIKEWAEALSIELKAKGFSSQLQHIFIDDNASGYTLDRPQFNQLKKKICSHGADKAHIIIVKDSSRIGRHNAKTLLFFELLQEQGVRIILATENYDSEKDNDDVIGIKTWYNEMYVKDISRKIRQSIKSKQKNGGFIVKNHYGYEKHPQNKHQLIIDQEAASVVVQIFETYLKGSGYRKIANTLNASGIKTPSQYHQMKNGGKFKVAEEWSPVHVQRIIANDIYIGVLRCGKTKKKKIKGPSVRTEREEQIIYHEHHPAIISKEDFQLAQQIAERRNLRKIHGAREGINLFSGFLFCGDCGGYHVARRRANRPMAYYCSSYHRQGTMGCSAHHVTEEELLTLLAEALDEIVQENTTDFKGLEAKLKEQLTNDDREAVDTIQKDINHKQLELKNYARQRARGQIDEGLYRELIEETNQSIHNLNHHRKKMIQYQGELIRLREERISPKELLEEILEKRAFTRRDIELLLDKIIVKESHDEMGAYLGLFLEIHWSFSLP